ncbi:hypothetical protein BJX99DRAFT_33748 [Aspergillus californicus]
MATSTNPCGFFNDLLPYELRHLIWFECLPHEHSSDLHPWRTGCWRPPGSSPQDIANPGQPRNNLTFCPGPIEVMMPLLLVNHEARNVALKWLRQQGTTMKIRFCEARQCHLFMRPFNPTSDVLYVAPDNFMDFYNEPEHIPNEGGRVVAGILTPSSNITRIAVPERLIWNGTLGLSHVLKYFEQVTTVFILIDAPSDFLSDNDENPPRQWELKDTLTPPYIWNWPNREFDLQLGDGSIRREGLYPLYGELDRLSKELAKTLSKYRIPEFEIRTFRVVWDFTCPVSHE